MSLKSRLIKIGEQSPELREDLYPILSHLERFSTEVEDEDEDEDEKVDAYHNGDYGDQSKNRSFYPDKPKKASSFREPPAPGQREAFEDAVREAMNRAVPSFKSLFNLPQGDPDRAVKMLTEGMKAVRDSLKGWGSVTAVRVMDDDIRNDFGQREEMRIGVDAEKRDGSTISIMGFVKATKTSQSYTVEVDTPNARKSVNVKSAEELANVLFMWLARPTQMRNASVKLSDQLVQLGYDLPSLRADIRPVLDHIRIARQAPFSEGDRVEVTDGAMKGLKVTIHAIEGQEALVSPTAHGKKTRVPFRNLKPVSGGRVDPKWPEGMGVKPRKRRSESFEGWMRKVDRALEAKVFMGHRDLPDAPYRSWFDSGMSAKEAADMALERAGYGGF